MAAALLALLGLAHLSTAWAGYYTVTSPNLRDTCSERCVDTSSEGVWRCDSAEADGGQICTTWEPKTHDCHFHYHTQAEAAECLSKANSDILYLGASYLQGMMATTFPWWDKSVKTADYFDFLDWMGSGMVNAYDSDAQGNSNFAELIAGQVNVDATGTITYKGGVTWRPGGTPYYDTLMNATPALSDSEHYLTLANVKGVSAAVEALTAIKTKGRAERPVTIMISIGAWYWYCFQYGGTYCDQFDEGTAVKTFGNAQSKVLTYLQTGLTTVAELIKKDFPKATMIFMDYGFKQNYYTFLPALTTLMKSMGTKYGYFLNVYQMANADNAPALVGGHPTHHLNMAMFTRVLSITCKDVAFDATPYECEEEMVGMSTCVWNDGLDKLDDAVGDSTAWYLQWYRPCEFTPYPSATKNDGTQTMIAYDGGDASAATGGGTATTSTDTTTGVNTNTAEVASVDFSIVSEIVLDVTPVSDYTGYTTATVVTTSDTSKPYQAWNYTPAKAIVALISLIFCTGIFFLASPYDKMLFKRDKEVAALELAAAAAAKAKAEATNDNWGYLDAFDGARYLASISVVAGHYQGTTPKKIESWYVIGWGFTWVPWFMMLSGFVLTYTSLKRQSAGKPAKREALSAYLTTRLMSVYPLYILGLVAAAGVAIHLDQWQDITWLEAFCNLTLTQAWVPTITENSLQAHCWFLSAIMPLWFFHQRIEAFVSSLNHFALWKLMIFMGFLGWLPVIIPYCLGADLDWYSVHEWGSTETWLDIFVVMLKFHPLFYAHVYTFGVGLACLFRNYRENPPYIFRFGAIIGYIGLACIFCIPAIQPPAYKLSCRLGLLAPLQGLILIGLACGRHDPVVWILSSWIFQVLGTYSYAQYVFQFVCMNIWNGWADLGFLVFMFAFCICMFKISVKLFGDKKDKLKFVTSTRICYGIFLCGVCIVGMIPSEITSQWVNEAVTTTTYETVGYVGYSNGAYDVRLNLTVPNLLGLSDEYDFINPSVLEVEGVTYIAARRHRMEYDITPDYYIEGKPVITTKWYSDIVFGKLNESSFEQVHLEKVKLAPNATTDLYHWEPCSQAPIYNALNGTWSQHIVTGPQDPRLLVQGTRLAMTFFSTIPNLGENYCPSDGQGIGFMYMTEGDLRTAEVNVGVVANKIAPPADTQLYEKNWMAFDEMDDNDGSTAFVTHITPFTPIKVKDAIKAQDEYVTTIQYGVTKSSLDYFAYATKVELHGGSNFIRIEPAYEDPYYLAAFHSLSNAGVYNNYLIKCYKQNPFYPIAVSRLIPTIVSDPSTCPVFVSGLSSAENGDRVTISYGSCDAESRVLSLSLGDVNSLFNHPESDDYWPSPSSYGVPGIGEDGDDIVVAEASVRTDFPTTGFKAFITVVICSMLLYCGFYACAYYRRDMGLAEVPLRYQAPPALSKDNKLTMSMKIKMKTAGMADNATEQSGYTYDGVDPESPGTVDITSLSPPPPRGKLIA